MKDQTIPIVFATDENYVPYCGVAISSLIKNTNLAQKYEVFILYDSLTALSIYRLERLSTENVTVECLCVHENITELKVHEYNHLTITSAFRLVIPDVLPLYEKIIYLDSDIIVNDDIAELFRIDIGDNILGAAPGYYEKDENGYGYVHIIKDLKISLNDFFNAGILVINTKGFIENNVKHICFSLLSTRRDLYFMDQCALNIVCKGKVHFLPIRWNYEWLYLFGLNRPSSILNARHYEMCDNPAIIHYDGIEKPWDYPEQFLSDYFWKYARNTIFYEEILYASQLLRMREMLEALAIVPKYRKVAIYGAGNAGRRYVDKLLTLKLCKIAIWVDKNYADKQGYELPVCAVEELFSTEFDHVFIAIENSAISNEVKDMLISNGILKEKIIQIRNA